MTVTAHGTRSVYHGATKRPLAPVRTVQQQRKPLGWLECSDVEFLRLLALHDAGQINLLSMPETSADAADDEQADDEQTEAPRRLGPANRDPGTTVKITNALARSTKPLTTGEIAKATGLTTQTVGTILRRNPQWFERAAGDNRWARWKRKDAPQ